MNKKPLLITLGIFFILVVAAIWVYLLLYGTPESPNEIYTNLGFEMSSQPTTVNPAPLTEPEPEPPTINTNTSVNPLQQLTVRPTAGFVALEQASSTDIRYVERGTGYIFDINLDTGEETPVSQTTIPQIAEALFTTSGDRVALTSYDSFSTSVQVGDITTDNSLDYIDLEPGAHSLAFSRTGDIQYAVSQNGVTRGYSQNLESETRRELFTFAFINTDVWWGSEYESIYLSTRPAVNLPGYVYTISETTLTPVLPSINNLHTFVTPHHTIATFPADGSVRTIAVDTSGVESRLPITVIPRKCAADPLNEDGLWCASPIQVEDADFLEEWNKGIAQSNDYIWYINIASETATLFANPDNLSGRSLDIDKIIPSESGRYLLLRNRTDQTLWLLDIDNL